MGTLIPLGQSFFNLLEFHLFKLSFLLYSVKWLVLDEADKLFEQGKAGFRDQVEMFCNLEEHQN